MMESETKRIRTLRSGWAGLLPHIGSMRDVYRSCNTKRITKFRNPSSRFLTRNDDGQIAINACTNHRNAAMPDGEKHQGRLGLMFSLAFY